MIDKEYARSQLSGQAMELFDDITFSRVLGASKHTEMIGQMLLSIVDNAREDSVDTVKRLRTVAGYFKETRGQNSRAIYNAINIMTEGLGKMDAWPVEQIREKMHSQIERYQSGARENTHLAVEYAAALCQPMDSIMIFDYSSTVDAFVKALKHAMTVYIPESRALNGGKPFVKGAIEAGHRVRFIPDTTMMEALRSCQAAFMGAETLYPDGSVFNTIGSDMLAVVARELGVPLYTISPLVKVDTRPVQGYVRLAPMPYDYGQRLAGDWAPEIRDAVDFTGIKLVKIPPQFISGIISEAGIIPACSFYDTAMQYSRTLERRVNES